MGARARVESLAVAQTVPVRGDLEHNLRQHARLAELAAERGAGVLVFPELSLTGYEIDLGRELALEVGDPRLDDLAALAASRELELVVGAPVRDGELVRLAAIVLRADGRRDVYFKRRLAAVEPEASPGGSVPPPESSVFTAGTESCVLELAGGRTGLAICADTGRPELAGDLDAGGARRLLAGVFSIPDELYVQYGRLEAIARRLRIPVAMANYGGPTGGLPAGGGSALWSESGERLAELPASGAGVAAVVKGADVWHVKAARS